jgi:hypothetical protein
MNAKFNYSKKLETQRILRAKFYLTPIPVFSTELNVRKDKNYET